MHTWTMGIFIGLHVQNLATTIRVVLMLYWLRSFRIMRSLHRHMSLGRLDIYR